jgi:hypothetical protein
MSPKKINKKTIQDLDLPNATEIVEKTRTVAIVQRDHMLFRASISQKADLK